MAVVSVPDERRTINDAPSMSAFLGQYGITYEQWKSARSVPVGASAEAVLQAYADKIDELKSRGGYTTADVIARWRARLCKKEANRWRPGIFYMDPQPCWCILPDMV
jgi:cupin superfamily acireductone dioxygenase involved in methionine salvage